MVAGSISVAGGTDKLVRHWSVAYHPAALLSISNKRFIGSS